MSGRINPSFSQKSECRQNAAFSWHGELRDSPVGQGSFLPPRQAPCPDSCSYRIAMKI